ncbi:hypothetical protein BDA99DRAFT_440672 [Phascolomyces articulosus]|uniref:Chromo domain-containing protein n=1 Tax=Phascolomyces articulosus TaxID=60185 RepID=A0AAD5K6Q4_9FUNG|nr:hypothetical protein BDA99DRAFT_440672 [Phascolomyces articulosus]
MKLYNKIYQQDCIAVDGGYTLFIKQFENLCKNKNINLDDKNFFYPIRKEIGVALNRQEEHYNKVFGSFRIAFLLKNINNFSDKFNIIIQDHHKLWFNDNFEFPSEMRLIDIVYTNQMEQVNKLKELNKLQDDFLNLDITDNNMIINEDTDDNMENNNNDKNINENEVDFPEYRNINKKRKKSNKRNSKKINIYDIRNTNNDENIYEIDKILNHKIENKNYIFYIKWVGYDDDSNSWVKESDFKQKEIIIDYFSERNIIYRN